MMNILIADDEAPARGELSYILDMLEPKAKLHEAKNGTDALKIIASQKIDVVFLDINMPGISGLAVANTIIEMKDPPIIIFATAYNEHAASAFEMAALDYLVKPFSEKRVAKTLERIHQKLAEKDLREESNHNLKNYLEDKNTDLKKIWLERENENLLLLDYKDIYWFAAEDKKVYAHSFNEKFVVRYTLKELENILSADKFIRVHKAYLVNISHISELVPWFSGNYLVRMKDENHSELKLSRRYAVKLKEITLWT
ncbi:MAG TPA: response regulator transcription factor [Trueperaceae bacterium]|nr:response regulator transcription factor [Trueperaceae bacterium]